MEATIVIRLDGQERSVRLDTRTTLLDALRDRLSNTSPKKGCDHGQCGACTVLVDGRRVLSCLTFAVAHENADVVTAEGLASGGDLHPVQRAFVEHDALQCGFCTPGQICSAVGMLDEAKSGCPSVRTEHLTGPVELDDGEIRERMSGNLCRCGAYVSIVAAVREAGETA